MKRFVFCFVHFVFVWIDTYRSWALPPIIDQLHTIKDIIGTRKVLKIGAGSGLWAALLRNVGCNIIPTDSKGEPVPDYIFVEK